MVRWVRCGAGRKSKCKCSAAQRAKRLAGDRLAKVEFGRLIAASDARLTLGSVKRQCQAESVSLSATVCLGFGL
jgi:hypothetical protein